MQIKTLRIGHFGKLHNVTIELADGLNLVMGDNESGKSTVHAFITAMLFGVEKTRGRVGKDDLYTKYLPWDTPGAYQGSMDFEHNGTAYRITRVFYQKEKSCILTELETGRKIDLAGDTITSLIPELTLSAWNNTVSMGQKALRFSNEFGDDMQNYIANLSMTGSGRVDVANALESLDRKRKSIRKNRNEEQKEYLSEHLKELREQERKADELGQEKLRLEKFEKNELKEADELKRSLPDTDILREELQRRREAVEAQLDLMQTCGENDDRRGTLRHYRNLGILLLAAGLVLALSFGGRFAVGIGLGVLMMIAGLVCLFAVAIRYREIRLEGQKDNSRENYYAAADAYNEASEKLEAAEGAGREMADQIREHERAAAQYGMEVEKAEWMLENMGDIGRDIEECEQELENALRISAGTERELAALDMAYSTIEQLSKDIRDDFANRFNDLLSEEVCLATDGKYMKARIGEDFSVEVMSDLDFVKAEMLSAGAAEQLYMAFRFAAARLMLGEVCVPMFLDESFAYCDEARLRAALSALADRENQQIVLFTCRRLERDMLAELGNEVNAIQL